MTIIDEHISLADRQLIAQGDAQAFARLFKLYYARLRQVAFHNTQSWADAEEIVQETLLSVWLHRTELPEVDNLKAWIFTITTNKYLDWTRRRLQARKPQLALAARHSEEERDTVFDEVYIKELNEIVHRAIAKLSSQRQKIYRLSREGGLKIAEVAEQLNIAESTVKNTLTTVLKHIREYLATYGHPLLVIMWYYWTKK